MSVAEKLKPVPCTRWPCLVGTVGDHDNRPPFSGPVGDHSRGARDRIVLCRTFQVLTGRTNVWLAIQLTNLSIIVYFMWVGVQVWSNEGAFRVAAALFGSGHLYLVTQTILNVPVERYESSAYQRDAKGLKNPRRVRDASCECHASRCP